MSAAACTATVAPVQEVGYHGSRRNALADIFENLDLGKLAVSPRQPRGKSCTSARTTNSRRTSTRDSSMLGEVSGRSGGCGKSAARRGGCSTDGSDVAHFAGTCCTSTRYGHGDVNANTSVVGRTLSSNGSTTKTSSHHNVLIGGKRSFSLHSIIPATITSAKVVAASTSSSNELNNGSVKFAQSYNSNTCNNTNSINNTNTNSSMFFQTSAPYNNTSRTDGSQSSSDASSSESLCFSDDSSNLPNHANAKTTSTATTSTTTALTMEKRNSKSVSRGEQSDNFSTSMTNLRAKDCAKRSMVC